MGNIGLGNTLREIKMIYKAWYIHNVYLEHILLTYFILLFFHTIFEDDPIYAVNALRFVTIHPFQNLKE